MPSASAPTPPRPEVKKAAVVADQACCYPSATVKKAVEVVKAAQAVPPVVAVPPEAPSAICSFGFLGITACMAGAEAPAVQAVEGVKPK